MVVVGGGMAWVVAGIAVAGAGTAWTAWAAASRAAAAAAAARAWAARVAAEMVKARHAKSFLRRYPHIFQHFEKLYLSHEVGCRKPAPESFLSVCKLMQCPPNQVIFLDDTKENIAGAKAAGLTPYLTRSQPEVVETLRSL